MGDEWGEQRWKAKPKAEPAPQSDRAQWANQSSAEHWREAIKDPVGRLRWMEARFARGPSNLDAFKAEVGEAIRAVDPQLVLGDPHVVGMVRALFGERGVTRLREKLR